MRKPITFPAIPDGLFYFVIGLLVVVLTAQVAFPRVGNSIFFSWDSSVFVANANEYVKNPMRYHSTVSLTQAFGALISPSNFKIIPEILLGMTAGKLSAARMFLWVAVGFYTLTSLTVRAFGWGPRMAMASAMAFVFLVLPYTSPPIYTESFWWLMPHWWLTVNVTLTMMLSFRFIGRGSVIVSLLASAAFATVVMWSLVSMSKGMIVLWLHAAVYCTVLVLASASWRELAWKIAFSTALATVLLFGGPLDYLRGTYGFATNSLFFAGSAENDGIAITAILGTVLRPPSEWIPIFPHQLVWIRYHLGYPLAVLGLAGGVVVLLRPASTRDQRVLAGILLSSLAFSLVFIYGQPVGGAVYPLLMLFTMLTLGAVAGPAWNSIRLRCGWVTRLEDAFATFRRPAPRVATASVIGFVGVVVLSLSNWAVRPSGYPYPPARTSVIAQMEADIRFSLGDPFRGRYVNLAISSELAKGADSTASAMMAAASRAATATGNDLTFGGPRYFDIPVATQPDRMATPVSLVFMNYLLTRPGENDRIDYRVITRFEPRLLRLLGVRYLLSNEPLSAPGLEVAENRVFEKDRSYQLYELSDVNTGGYAVQTVERRLDFAEILERLDDPTFDPRATAIIGDEWGEVPTGLVPAEATMTRIGDGLRIKAASPGRSLVVLPFEYSRCWEMRPRKGTARIGRADLMLTGLLFEGEAEFDLLFRFGPFTNASCRLADMTDILALNLTAGTLKALQLRSPGRLLFSGLQ